jgi:hypothetical protein
MLPLTYTSNQLLFTTARLQVTTLDGQLSVGTGFFFAFALRGDEGVPVLVTCKHVMKNARTVEISLHLSDATHLNSPAASSFRLSMDQSNAIMFDHPDADVDLTAILYEPLRSAALANGHNAFTRHFTEEDLPSDADLRSLRAVEDVVMAGYPIGLSDQANNLPIIRRGTTATHPAVAFNGQPRGVIDIACLPGSSGSPVLLLNEGIYVQNQALAVGTRKLLLGVLFAGPRHRADGSIEIVEIPTAVHAATHTYIPIHLGYYVRAAELLRIKDLILPHARREARERPSNRAADDAQNQAQGQPDELECPAYLRVRRVTFDRGAEETAPKQVEERKRVSPEGLENATTSDPHANDANREPPTKLTAQQDPEGAREAQSITNNPIPAPVPAAHAPGSSSKEIIAQSIAGEYSYAKLGLILGLTSIAGGVVMGLHGVVGHTSWTAKALGIESNLSDAAPGVVLFIVGLFMIWATRPRVDLKGLIG